MSSTTFKLSVFAFAAFVGGILYQRNIGFNFAKRMPTLSQVAVKIEGYSEIPSKGTIFLGDSLVQNFDWSESLGEHSNLGVNGATVAEVLELSRGKECSIAFVLAGANDAIQKTRMDKFRRSYRELLQSLKCDQIYVLTFPCKSEWLDSKGYNEAIVDEATGIEKVVVIDLAKSQQDDWFMSDGIHFTRKGYREIAKLIKDKAKKKG